jgi:tetratricopeptide (TPR) repeat protein
MKTIFLLLAAALLAAPAMCGEQAASRFDAADALFLHRIQHENAREALRQYRELYKAAPDAEAAWRVSMACYFVGFNIAKDGAAKKQLYAEGREAGLYAVAHSSGSAAAHFWTGVNMALYGETVGVLKMLFTLGAVREHLEKSAALDSAYAYAGAYRILGKIDESLPGVLGGSSERAQSYYRKAITLAPDEPVNYLFLARLYMERYHDRPEARRIAQQGLSLPALDETRYESLKGRVELQEYAANELKTKTPD